MSRYLQVTADVEVSGLDSINLCAHVLLEDSVLQQSLYILKGVRAGIKVKVGPSAKQKRDW